MNGRDLIQKILNTKVYGYEADVIIRTPDCRAYRDCHIHVANGQNGQIIMIDLIEDEQILPGNDYDLDKTIHSTPPVEGEDNLDILAKSYADVVKYNTLKYNTEHYPAIVNMMNTIIKASNEGKTICSFIFPDKMAADDSGVYYEEDEICGIVRWHFDKLGYNINELVNNKGNYVEFIISW